MPGYDWAPAWVSWADGDDYYGWAPLSPGLSVNVSIGSIPADRWCFVPHQYINSPSVHNYYVDNSRSVTIYNHAAVINNVRAVRKVNYVAGPKRTDVERSTHAKIQTRTLSFSQKPGRTVVNNNTINIYRPGAKRNTPKGGNSNTTITPGNNAGRQNNKPPVTHNTPNNPPAQAGMNRTPTTTNHQHTTPYQPKRTHTQRAQPATTTQQQPRPQPVQQPKVQQQRVQPHRPQQPVQQQPRPQQQQPQQQPQPQRQTPPPTVTPPSVQNNQPRPGGNSPVERNPGEGGHGREPQKVN